MADATARRVPRGCRDGEFPDAELGMELVTSQNAARDQMDLAGDLQTRLPRTWAALGAGVDRRIPGPADLAAHPVACLMLTPPMLMRSWPRWRRGCGMTSWPARPPRWR